MIPFSVVTSGSHMISYGWCMITFREGLEMFSFHVMKSTFCLACILGNCHNRVVFISVQHTVNVVRDNALRVTILKQKFLKIVQSGLQQWSQGANSEAAIGERVDEINFVLARCELPFSLSSAPASLFFLSLVFTNRSLWRRERCEWIPFSVEACECLLTVNGGHESFVRAAFDKDV